MPFDTLSDRLKLVAGNSLQLCRHEWGGQGLRQDEEIDGAIGWLPTFYLKPNKALIVAVEVSDVIYPEILKIAAHDIEQFDFPISIYEACALDIYQKDQNMARANMLRHHGFGCITVDGNGGSIIQWRAPPIAQHIAPSKFDAAIKPMTSRLKVSFKQAYATYQTNVGQGLQEASQVVEAMIHSMVVQAIAANVIPAGTAKKDTADKIDDLYSAFLHHRAALGAARSFAREYRNVASHPAKTPRQAAEKLRKCKAGFLEALRVASELREAMQRLGYQVRIV
jgi:hypothetical protein